MALPRFFKQKSPNRFDYQPIYWDPEKEAREERINRIKAELGYEMPGTKRSTTITRGSFRNYDKSRGKVNKDSNRRLVIIIAVLLLISYFLLYR